MSVRSRYIYFTKCISPEGAFTLLTEYDTTRFLMASRIFPCMDPWYVQEDRLSPPTLRTVAFLAAFDVGLPSFAPSSRPVLLCLALFFILSVSRRHCASGILHLLFHTFPF
jgi:hypothetical protein